MRVAALPSSSETVEEQCSDVTRDSATRTLREVIDKGPRTLTELGNAAGVSRPTIRRTVDLLISKGYLRDCDPRSTDVGRPARTIALASGATSVLGIVVTETRTRLRLASVTGCDRGSVEIDSAHLTREDDPGSWINVVDHEISTLCRSADVPMSSIDTAVVSVSGIVTPQGSVRYSIATPAFAGCELAELLRARTGIEDILVENDTVLCALGEMRTGAARDLEDFLYVRTHRTVHPALVIGGEVHRGADSAVGESDILQRLGIVPETMVIDGVEIPFLQVGTCLDRGELGRDWLSAFVDVYSRMLAALSYITDPEAIVISGGETTTSRDCLDRIEQYIASTRVTSRSPRLLAGRGEADVGLLGALHLATHRALAREFGTTTDLPVPTIDTGLTQGGVQK